MAARMAPRISLVYALVGLAWIGGSSLIVWWDTAAGPVMAEVIKGATFVVVTASLIYWLARQGEEEIARRNERLTALHDLLRGVLDGSEDMIGAWDRQKRFTAVNPQFQDVCKRLFDRAPEVGSTLMDLVGHFPEKHLEFDQCWDRTLSGESFVVIQQIDMNGAQQWYETSYGCLRASDGHVVGGFHIIRNTTERRRSEFDLINREQRLQAILDHVADYVVIVGADMACRYYSAGFSSVTGIPEEEALRQPQDAFIHPDDLPVVRNAIASSIRSGVRVRGLEYRRRHADGRWHDHLLNGGRLEQDGEAAFLAVVQDISEQKFAEAKASHSAKLATVGEFAAGLAHELAHPVAVIRLAAESALDHATDGEPRDDYLHEQVSLIDDQARRMASLIDHIRAFSRRGSAPDMTFAPQDVIIAVTRMVEKQMEIDGIGLRTHICDNVRPATGDPLRLEEVVLNLLSNARAAIRARRLAERDGYHGEISVACCCGDESVQISVSDNGTGIAWVDQDRIFEPFFTTREIGDGLGLGLSISQTIMKSLGGSLTFTSIPGSTEFRLTLPAANTRPPTKV